MSAWSYRSSFRRKQRELGLCRWPAGASQTLAKSAEGAANLREYHQQLFRNSVDSLRQEIERITGRKVREAAAEVDPGSGSVTHMFTTGTTVQVFLMDGNVPSQSIPGDSHLPA